MRWDATEASIGRADGTALGSFSGDCKVEFTTVKRWKPLRKVQLHVEGCMVGPLQTITAILTESKSSVILLRIAMQETMGAATPSIPTVD